MSEQEQGVRRVSDIVGGSKLPGEQVKVSELVDTEFVINSIDERKGEWGPYLGVAIEVKGEEYYFWTAHQVITQKLAQCKDDLPLFATIVARESEESGRTYFDIE